MSNKTRRVVDMFRGEWIPRYVNSKTELIKYVLLKHRYNEPITNWEFVSDLRCTRFSGVLYDLRKDGWEIETVSGKVQGHYVYYLQKHPEDVPEQASLNIWKTPKLTLVTDDE